MEHFYAAINLSSQQPVAPEPQTMAIAAAKGASPLCTRWDEAATEFVGNGDHPMWPTSWDTTRCAVQG